MNTASGEFYLTSGDSIDFESNVYDTEDENKIKFLREHPYFNNIITTFNPDAELTSPAVLLKQLKKRIRDEQKFLGQNIETRGKKWTCPFCDEPFISGFALGKHKQLDHANEYEAIKELQKMNIDLGVVDTPVEEDTKEAVIDGSKHEPNG